MATTEEQRYLAVIKALYRPALNALFLCVATTLVATVVIFVGLDALIGVMPDAWPAPIRGALTLGIAGVAIVILPSLSQLLIIHGKTARAIEALNAFGLAETTQYERVTGSKPPTLRNAKHARTWLSKNEGNGTRVRTRTLIWVGELNAASELIAAMPLRNAAEAFHRSLLREELEFVATGTMNLDEPTAHLSEIPASSTRDEAIVSLAFERARLELEHGNDPFVPLADARTEIASVPQGASIRDRFMVGVRATAVIFVVFAVVGLVNASW